MKVESESEVAQSCLTLSDPMDCSPPGSSIHGIFRATVLEWGATSILRAANSQGRWDSKSGWAKSGFPWGSLQRFTVSLIHSVLKRRNTEALPCQHPGAPERKSRWGGRLTASLGIQAALGFWVCYRCLRTTDNRADLSLIRKSPVPFQEFVGNRPNNLQTAFTTECFTSRGKCVIHQCRILVLLGPPWTLPKLYWK